MLSRTREQNSKLGCSSDTRAFFRGLESWIAPGKNLIRLFSFQIEVDRLLSGRDFPRVTLLPTALTGKLPWTPQAHYKLVLADGLSHLKKSSLFDVTLIVYHSCLHYLPFGFKCSLFGTSDIT